MTGTWRRETLSVDEQLALRTAAGNLVREFEGTFGAETIERFLHTSYEPFAATATVSRFQLLAERFARQRLRALAKVEGRALPGTPVVLFVCTHNAGRSQMALGFFNHLAGDRAVAWSGGSEPASELNPAVIDAMAERAIDISDGYAKPWTDDIVRAADVVVGMGCGDACPVFPGRRYEEWVLDDPAGLTLDGVRPIRDAIESRVQHLVTDVLAGGGSVRPPDPGSAQPRLQPLDWEILRLLAEGRRAAAVAARLRRTPSEIGERIRRIMGTLGCDSQLEVLAWYWRHRA